jgi:hypothetical protein
MGICFSESPSFWNQGHTFTWAVVFVCLCFKHKCDLSRPQSPTMTYSISFWCFIIIWVTCSTMSVSCSLSSFICSRRLSFLLEEPGIHFNAGTLFLQLILHCFLCQLICSFSFSATIYMTMPVFLLCLCLSCRCLMTIISVTLFLIFPLLHSN